MKNFKRRISITLICLALIAVTASFISISVFRVTGTSMESTLQNGDLLVALRIAIIYRDRIIKLPQLSIAAPDRGDIILFYNKNENNIFIKRVIGVGGDTIIVRNGIISINGSLINEPYARQVQFGRREPGSWHYEHLLTHVNRKTYGPTKQNWGPIKVPHNTFFVLGDNRVSSTDSRDIGVIAEHELIALPIIAISFRNNFMRFMWQNK
jgi:signal peptidase I